MTTTLEGHVAVFAFPFGSHAAPLLNLVCRLAASAPNLQFSFFSTSKSNEKIFSRTEEVNELQVKPYNVDEGVPEGHVFSGHPLEAVELFLKAMPQNFKKAMEAAVEETGQKVTCLLTDAFLSFSGEMAAQMGVPWVAFWTAAQCSISVHVNVDLIRSTIGLTGMEENGDKTLDFLPGLSVIHARDLPEGILYDLEAPFSLLLYNMGQEVPRAQAVALSSFEEIDPTVTAHLKTKLQRVLNVGPLPLASPPPSFSDPSGCIPWLDTLGKASVAYLSFGTILNPPPHEIMALAEALEANEVPFIWSLRDSSKKHLLGGIIERTGKLGKLVPWAPQLQVLNHPSTGVFITHCGWNSVSESIAGGVPMICRPFFGDQKLNGRYLEDVWKIGVKVEGGVFTKSGTMKALDLVLSKEDGRKMRDNIGLLKESAKFAVGPNGSSTKNFSALVEVVTTNQFAKEKL